MACPQLMGRQSDGAAKLLVQRELKAMVQGPGSQKMVFWQ